MNKQKRARNAFAGSKFASSYWVPRVYRPTYTRGGRAAEVGQWYAQIQNAGRREQIGLGTNDRQEAARRAARLYQRVKAAGWESALREFAPDKAEPTTGFKTVGDVIKTATEAKAADIRPRTLRDYANGTRCLAALVFGIKGDESRFDYVTGGLEAWRAKVDRIRLSKLTPARVQAAVNRRIAAARGNPLLEQRARTTAASLVRTAKATFAAAAAASPVPFDNPLATVRVKGAGPRHYHSTVDAAALLRDAQAELAEADPESYKALLLALAAGLRKSEIDALQWQQVDAAASVIRVGVTADFAPKSEASAGEVFVDPGLIAELEPLRAEASGLFVLESAIAPRPSATFGHYRAAKTFGRLTHWLRSKGVLALKPLHALRKEFGSIIAASADIHTASRQLRHSGIGITSAYYADSRRRVAPPVAAILGLETETASAIASK